MGIGSKYICPVSEPSTVDGLIGTLCPSPKINFLKREIQPNFPENRPISALFQTIETPTVKTINLNQGYPILFNLRLGLAYAGSWREDVIGVLSEVYTDKLNNVNDKLITTEVISVTALSIGLISLGSCNAELAVKLLSIFSKEGYNMKSTFNRLEFV